MYEVARGDNVTLPCQFQPKTPDNPLVVVTWTADDTAGVTEDDVAAYYYPLGRTDIKPDYEGRVSLQADVPKGLVNLMLSSVTLKDNKSFHCHVLIPGDDKGTTKDTTRLLVLVAPSTPICKLIGDAEYFQNIQLTCKSEEGSPAPTYQWERRDVQDRPLPQDPKTTDKDGVLSLFNITKETSGYYICTATNKIRSASCKFTLSVMPPSMKLGSTPAIIGGIAGVLTILGIIACVVCCCRKKKRNKEEEYAMGVHEKELNAKEPLRNGRQGDGEDDVRSDIDESSVRRADRNEERSIDAGGRRRDHDDQRSDNDTGRSDYSDRHSDFEDRRDRYSDRHERYDDNRRDDRRTDDYDRRRHDDYDDRRRRDDYDDRRRYDDDRRRYDEDRDRDRAPSVPPNKPNREDYDY
ncbi:cell surface A33 antigen-like isoform X2 [Thalassophryne amazonica]|nr:cell surface A33 antigen-like isoform X2 [Thalassophryne amazonica]